MNQHQIKKPKTRPGKRFLENREPKLIENDKKTIFIRGVNTNNVVLTAMKDFASMKKPNCVLFNKKNDIKPMENPASLEFFCQKTDASLFMFGSHNKKRPNNLVAGRIFDSHVLDIFEMGIEDFKSMKDFKTAKIASGSKPMLLFAGDFEETVEYSRLKSFFMDFFRGPVVDYINLKGLEHLLVFALVKGKILFRSYRTTLKKLPDSKTPSVELTEIGPHMNFVLRRKQLASDDLFKYACRKPKQLKPTKIKNKKLDTFGTTHGRIHMERQDYSKLQVRKLKGLKKRKFEKVAADNQPENLSKKMKTEESLET